MNDVLIVIPIFGDDPIWRSRAERAYESAKRQTVSCDVIVSKEETLMDARNKPAFNSDNKYLIFLDADDEISDTYVEHMMEGSADIRRPSTIGVLNGVEDDYPVMIKEKPIETSNYIVIGAMADSRIFKLVGGFNNYPILEDWDLWIRMINAGATVQEIPKAIYKVNVRPQSRNNNSSLHSEYYNIIRRSNFGSA